MLEAVETLTRAKAGKYLAFALGRETYGVEVLKIREIIRMTDITTVPRMPDFIKGVINLRGKIIPVIDLRIRFALASAELTERTCIVVVQVALHAGHLQMGLIVDGVEEVLNVGAGEIEGTPDFGAKVDTEYIIGMAKVKDTVVALLDIDRVVAGETLENIKEQVAR